MNNHSPAASLLALALILELSGIAQTKRLITAEDCVTVKYLNDDGVYSPLQINKQGTRLAYVVKSPNLKENRNDIQLYVQNLRAGAKDPAKLVLVADTISQIHWAENGEQVFLLINEGSHVTVSTLNVVTGERSVVASPESDIKEYTVDVSGDTIVFATEDQPGVHVNKPTDKQIAEGYRIPFQSENQNRFIQRRLFITRRFGSNIWSRPTNITVQSPLTGQKLTSFAFTPCLRLSISPNGKQLVFTYLISEQEQLPTEWRSSLIGRLVLNNGAPPMTVLHIDLDSMQATLPFKTAWAFSVPMWSADSTSFAIAAASPIGSSWEREDTNHHQDLMGSTHLFWIEPATGRIAEILKHVANPLQGPLSWSQIGDMLVEAEDGGVIRLSQYGGVWQTIETFRSPSNVGSVLTHEVSDGFNIIGEHEDPSTPPELVWYRLRQSTAVTFAKLDSQFDTLTLATAKTVEWETSTGYKLHGLLFVPPDYVEGQSYPLVIQAYQAPAKFFCDYGEGHWPSFPPQPLADAGVMYLIRVGDADSSKEDLIHRPADFPGTIGEAALQAEIWDSAVKTFADRGWIDINHVGIIGFSRAGWYTEFTLSQSKLPYAAATVTDNITYSPGEYWLFHQQAEVQGDDHMYGGPPYGATLKNWLKYAPAFNVDRIHTPVLMEEMGHGISYDNEQAPPLSLVSHFELFTGLNRLGTPVELYYYPREGHTPDHPQARLASLQRNVDWYRFWLQDYERQDPEDTDQYKRWEHLRDVQRSKNNSDDSTTGMKQ
jgi:dipeptidyl aminopeptidase/acylaminoacyl peptidase